MTYFVLISWLLLHSGFFLSCSSSPEKTSPATKSPFNSTHAVENTTYCPCDKKPQVPKVEHPLVAELENASLFYQLHRRATHSREAFEATLYITSFAILVAVAVFLSKMWRDKANFTVQQKQPIKYTQNDRSQEMLVKDMLKQRARSFVQLFRKGKERRRHEKIQQRLYRPQQRGHGSSLEMETFLTRGDQVDSAEHQRILNSSSSEEDNLFILSDDTTSDDDEGSVFAFDKRTGEWQTQRLAVPAGYLEPSSNQRQFFNPCRRRERTPPPRTEQAREPLMANELMDDDSDAESDTPLIAVG